MSSQPAVIAGDPLPVRPSLWAVTDGQRRADNAFSLTAQNMSFTYTAAESNPAGRLTRRIRRPAAADTSGSSGEA